jgi:cytochrome P450
VQPHRLGDVLGKPLREPIRAGVLVAAIHLLEQRRLRLAGADLREVTHVMQQGRGHQVRGCARGFCERARLEHVGGQVDLLTQVATQALAGEQPSDAIDRRCHPASVRHATIARVAVSSRQAPPGPSGHFLLGNIPAVSRDQLGFLLNCARQYGDFVRLKFGRRTIILLNNPREVEEVLVTRQRNFAKGYFYRILGPLLGNGLLTSEGDFWLRQRRLAQPAFHRERINAYAHTMVEYTRELLAGWREAELRDVHDDMMRLTLRVVGKTLFDTDIVADAPEVGEALPVALHELSNQMTGPEFLLPGRIPTPSRYRLQRAVRRLDPVVYRIIAQRRADSVDHGDLLSALLRAEDEDGNHMTDRQLRDEAMTIVLAGHETTALALTWSWYLLSEHPLAQQRLAAELETVLAGRLPTLAEVPQLPYTEAVILETMRLYPPIFGIGRESIADCQLGEYFVPAGTNVYIVPWVIPRDPRFFEEPEAFRPDRWLDGLARRLPRFAYFPFGGGPRLCMGQQFAMLEAVLVLSTIAQRWRLVHAPEHAVEMVPALTLRPKHGMRMQLLHVDTNR